MTISDWIAVGVPTAAFVLAMFSTYAGPLGNYLAVRTHNARLVRITNAAGRIAAGIAETLAAQPPGISAKKLREQLINSGVDQIKKEFAESVAATGGTDAKVQKILSDEVSKLVVNPIKGTVV